MLLVSRASKRRRNTRGTMGSNPDKYFELGGLIHRERYWLTNYYYVPCQIFEKLGRKEAKECHSTPLTCLTCICDPYEHLHLPKGRPF
jgi:hypothetical protein